jgi:hypothetical protein
MRGSVPIDGIFGSQIFWNENMLCGYSLGFSDHLCLWIDIPKQVLLGSESTPTTFRSRRLQNSDPRTVKRYINIYKKHIRYNHMLQKVHELTTQTLSEHARKAKWDAIDNALLKAQLSAEEKCRKLRMGTIQWTPEYAKWRLSKKIWCLSLKKKSEGSVDRRFLKQIAGYIGESYNHDRSVEEIQEQITLCSKHLECHKANSNENRHRWLDGLASAIVQNSFDNISEAQLALKHSSTIKMLIHREEQRHCARIIRRVVKTNDQQALTSITYINQAGQSVTSTERDVMERELLLENQRRFNQAASSAILQQPLCNEIESFGQHNQTLRVLVSGRFSSNVDKYTELLGQQLKLPDGFSPNQMDLSTDNYIKGWRKAKERTASGRSGLHFGHFIAGSSDETIACMEYQLSILPLQHGFSPSRWQQGVEVMLLKQPNNYNVEKLRVILLFEADFDFNNKRIGREMMFHAEQNHWIAPKQYGSRASLSSINHCINKLLSFDILRQTRTAGAVCINDMKGCYDRIVHSFAAMCMQ